MLLRFHSDKKQKITSVQEQDNRMLKKIQVTRKTRHSCTNRKSNEISLIVSARDPRVQRGDVECMNSSPIASLYTPAVKASWEQAKIVLPKFMSPEKDF